MSAESPRMPAFYICESERLLLRKDLSVTEIAATVGFADVNYFIKVFKAEKGHTPTECRREFIPFYRT